MFSNIGILIRCILTYHVVSLKKNYFHDECVLIANTKYELQIKCDIEQAMLRGQMPNKKKILKKN